MCLRVFFLSVFLAFISFTGTVRKCRLPSEEFVFRGNNLKYVALLDILKP
jgi:hypothetical protein